jgi:hypothetical protein
MSTAQFLPLFSDQPNPSTAPNNDQAQQLNFLFQTALLMKARSANENYLSTILQPILCGNQALPIHLKILLEKILEHFNAADVRKALQLTGWTLEDLQRGYVLVVSLIRRHFLMLFLFQDNSTGQPPDHYKSVSVQTQLTLFQMIGAIFPKLQIGIESLRQSLLQSLIGPQSMSLKTTTIEEEEEDMNAEDPKPIITATNPTPSTTPNDSRATSCSVSEESHSTDSTDPAKKTAPQRSFKSNKRRVQCEICQRSFCDKGALKIHNSAVHLRETHVCTVTGCGRVFSSRRSRNRHSGNPNLHTSLNLQKNPTPIEQSLNCTVPSFKLNGDASSVLSILSQLPMVSCG